MSNGQIRLALALVLTMTSCACVKLPQGVYYEVKTPEYTIVDYSNALIEGEIEFHGSTDLYDAEYHKNNMRVEIKWGEDPNALTNNIACTLNTVSGFASYPTVSFNANINGLEDGNVYYYSVRIIYGSEDPYTIPPLEFFILPKGPVNLDLSSGNVWSATNLGAMNPEEDGFFYAWGETEPKSSGELYNWSDYKWCGGSNTTIKKYCTDSSWGKVDGKTVLDAEDDAATLALGAKWQIPSCVDWNELLVECEWAFGKYNGIEGHFIRSKKDLNNPKKVIFIPYSGLINEGTHELEHYSGSYWSNNLASDWASDCAYVLGVDSVSHSLYSSSGGRCSGRPIRPVQKAQ